MKKILKIGLGAVFGLYLLLCATLYFFQEKIIFHPEKLPANYTYSFDQEFEEHSFKTEDGTLLNGLLFKADTAKGLIFYLHGNAGSLRSWGTSAKAFTASNYDVFMLDYRGFGKSQGEMQHEEQVFSDNQLAYSFFKKRYPQNKIIIVGYSIGTGMAAQLAAVNKPQQLILLAPYYSLTYIMQSRYALAPTFLLKYPFQTHQYLQNTQSPITIFHGLNDGVLPFESSLKLKQEMSAKIDLIPLPNQGHGGVMKHPVFQQKLSQLLAD
jgi:pimeloyl-ACP methyl ester carboxylesterase